MKAQCPEAICFQGILSSGVLGFQESQDKTVFLQQEVTWLDASPAQMGT